MSEEEFKLPEGIKDPSLEFDLADSLGKGSFGAVYKATYKKTGREVAIKQVLVNDDFMEILKEINFMKQCKSKYVVQYYGNYFKGDQCWIVMEYCSSGSVGDLLALCDAPFTEQQIAMVCRSTLKGLYYLHKSNKIHRDIKPGNILVNAKGECKLADFGVSGQLSERTRKRNTVIGTPFFLAPEVIQEVGYDSKADIWALGISAIEMAEKHPPYHDVHPMRVLFLIPTSTPPTLKEQDKWSPEFNDFLKCCLNKDPAQRLSAKQLLKHPFIEKGGDMSVMTQLINDAQMVIDQHGGSRLGALKEIQKKRAGGSDSDDDNSPRRPKSDSDSDSDVSDSDSDSDSSSSSSDDEPPKQQKFSEAPHRTSLDELDSILNGILSKSQGDNNKPKVQDKPKSPATTATPAKPAQQAPPTSSSAEDELEALLSGLQAKAKVKETPVAVPSPTPVKLAPSNRTPSSSNLPPSSPKLGALASPTFVRRENAIAAQWTAANNGGCTNTPSWRRNQQYIFTVASATSVRVTLTQQDLTNAIGFYVAKASPDKMKLVYLGKDSIVPGSEVGFQKAKYVTVEFKAAAGDYIVVPTTYQAGATGSYELEVSGATGLQAVTKQWCEPSCEGEWKGAEAGGCYSGTSTTWRNNPKFVLNVTSPGPLTMILTKNEPVNTSVFVGVYVFKAGDQIPPTGSLLAANLATKTNFINGLEVVHTHEFAAGKYVILPCSYDVGQEGKFTITVCSKTNNITLTKPAEKTVVTSGEWKGPTAGGCLNHASWRTNPQFFLTVSKPSRVTVLLEQVSAPDVALPFIGFYVLQAAERKKAFILSTKDVITNTEFINDLQIAHTFQVDSTAIILPSTFKPNTEGKFNLRVSTEDGELIVNALPNWEAVTVNGEWNGPSAGGRYSAASNAWMNNPRIDLMPSSPNPTRIALVLTQSEKPSPLGIGFYIFKRLPDNSLKAVIGKSGFVSGKEVAMEAVIGAGEAAIVIPATFEPGQNDTFSVTLYSDQRCAFV